MRSVITLSLILLAGCGLTGLGPSAPPAGQISLLAAQQITPRSKGGTLMIRPSSKGGTLQGSVIWPTEVAPLPQARFLITVFWQDQPIGSGYTDRQGRFSLADLPEISDPAERELRIQAQVPDRPHVILKQLLQLDQAKSELSMLTTAAAAVLGEARAVGDPQLAGLSAARLLQDDLVPLLRPLAQTMTPLLEGGLSQPIEQQPAVRESLAQTRTALASYIKDNPLASR